LPATELKRFTLGASDVDGDEGDDGDDEDADADEKDEALQADDGSTQNVVDGGQSRFSSEPVMSTGMSARMVFMQILKRRKKHRKLIINQH
jgi:hypothetical protein